MANGVTTEWEDIHVRLGNYNPRPTITPQSELNKQAQELVGSSNPLEDRDLEDLEDELENDEFFLQYKQLKMREMEKKSQEV